MNETITHPTSPAAAAMSPASPPYDAQYPGWCYLLDEHHFYGLNHHVYRFNHCFCGLNRHVYRFNHCFCRLNRHVFLVTSGKSPLFRVGSGSCRRSSSSRCLCARSPTKRSRSTGSSKTSALSILPWKNGRNWEQSIRIYQLFMYISIYTIRIYQ